MGFPHERSTPPEARPLFRTYRPRVSGGGGYFELALAEVLFPFGLPCGSPWSKSDDAYDRLLLPTT
jgi:hypothetical protein